MPRNGIPLLKGKTKKQLKSRKDRERKALMNDWHEAAINEAPMKIIEGQMRFECYHCEKYFPREYLIGDHWPHTRGARKDLILDPRNRKASCGPCNVSNNPNRKKPTEADLAPFYPIREDRTEEELGFGYIPPVS